MYWFVFNSFRFMRRSEMFRHWCLSRAMKVFASSASIVPPEYFQSKSSSILQATIGSVLQQTGSYSSFHLFLHMSKPPEHPRLQHSALVHCLAVSKLRTWSIHLTPARHLLHHSVIAKAYIFQSSSDLVNAYVSFPNSIADLICRPH